MIIAYSLGILAGIASTTQGSVNAGIRDIVKSPYITTLLNFITGICVLVIIVLATEGDLNMHRELIASQPAWILLGGFCGVIIVMLGIICIPVLGSARNVMLLCFGQIMAGLLIDHYGLFGAPVYAMSLKRLIGALLVLIGIALISFEGSSDRSADGSIDPRVLRYLPLPVISGFVAAVQVAVNGTLGEVIESSAKATLISMSAGLFNTIALTLIIIFFSGQMGIFSTSDGKEVTEEDIEKIRFSPLMLFGGPLAVVIVGGNAVAAPLMGTGMVTITNLIGMMGSGLAVDATGFLGIKKKPVTLKKIAGMALMAAGTVLISLVQ